MERKKLLCIITMVLLVFLLIDMFLPVVGDSTASKNLWEILENNAKAGAILVLLELLAGIGVCVASYFGMLKDYKFVYFPVGFLLTFDLVTLFGYMDLGYTSYIQIGLWLGILLSIGVFVLLIISSLSGDNNVNMFGNRGGRGGRGQPIGHDPKTGRPIYQNYNQQPYGNNMGNQMYNNPYNDPYNNQNNGMGNW